MFKTFYEISNEEMIWLLEKLDTMEITFSCHIMMIGSSYVASIKEGLQIKVGQDGYLYFLND